MGEVFERILDDSRAIHHGEAHFTQVFRNSDRVVEVLYGIRQIRTGLEAHDVTQTHILLIRRSLVEPQDMRQEHGVQRPVMELLLMQPSGRMAERVNASQSLHESEGALIACHHHMPARFGIRTILHSAFQHAHPERAVCTIISDTLRRRIDGRRQHRLDTMGQRIHSGGRCQMGGKTQRQVRIAQGHNRDEIR